MKVPRLSEDDPIIIEKVEKTIEAMQSDGLVSFDIIRTHGTREQLVSYIIRVHLQAEGFMKLYHAPSS